MNTIVTVEVIYFVIGFILANKWFNDEYKEDYDKAENKEKGVACLLLLFMSVLWPIKFVYNLVKKGKI